MAFRVWFFANQMKLARVSLPADDLKVQDILINTFECGVFNDLGRCPVRIAFDCAVPKFGQSKLYETGPEAFSDPLNLQLSFTACATA